MRTVLRERFKIAVAFAGWCAIVALRAIFTQPFEVLWFVGIGAAFCFAATCGYVYRGLKPYRDHRFRIRR